MGFADSIRTCLSKYVDFNGVASRSEFWWFMLFGFLGSIVLSVVGGMINFALLGNLFGLAILLPQLAVGARRLHDTGRSGWLQLLLLIPLIGLIVLIVFWVQESKH